MMTGPKHEKWMVIVNPNAGNGKGYKDWDSISELLKLLKIDFDYRITERRHHATELTHSAITAGFRKFISVGGDGTVHEIVNGIFNQQEIPTRDFSIAMIPVGTGNDWGRLFGIPNDYKKAAEVIARGRTTLHDAGLAYFYNGSIREKRYFINIAGLGFDALVVVRTNKQKKKGNVSKMAYMWSLLKILLTYKFTTTTIEVEGENITDDTFSVSLGIGKYSGGGMRQTPGAVYNDGLFDVTTIKKMSKLEVILNLKRLYNGTVYENSKIKGYRGPVVKVDSEPLIYVEADGESLGHTPAEFRIIPQSINVVISSDPEE